MGKWFLTDNSATVGRILMMFSAKPHETILMKWWKNQPSSTSAKAGTQNLHFVHSGFWPILAYFCPKVLRFLQWEVFSCDGKLSTARGTFEPKSLLASPYNPIVWPKTFFLVYKNTLQIFFGFLSKGWLNLWARYAKPPKNWKKIFFLLGATRAWSSNLCADEFPHYNTDPVKRVS